VSPRRGATHASTTATPHRHITGVFRLLYLADDRITNHELWPTPR
jgi:hypothetical protein